MTLNYGADGDSVVCDLGNDVEKSAPAKVLTFVHIVQEPERCLYLGLRRFSFIGKRAQGIEPEIMTLVQKGHAQLFLRSEMLVEACLGHIGLGNDLVDAGGVVPLTVK